MLREVAKRLKEELREEDTKARLGGDEFVVLFSELSDEPEQAANLAQLGAEKLQQALSVSYEIHGYELHLTANLVETMITMAEHLGLEVVAEGVETEEQLDFLREKGCKTCLRKLFALSRVSRQ